MCFFGGMCVFCMFGYVFGVGNGCLSVFKCVFGCVCVC